MPTTHTPFPIAGRAALVTGGRRGLGAAIVDELLQRGATTVYATARAPFEHPDPRVTPLVVEVADAGSVAAAAAAAGDVELVVSNAASFSPGPVLADDRAGLRADLDANLFGLLNVARAFAPVLARHDRSALLSVLSVVSWFSGFGVYGVSKAAALSATDAIRLELAAQHTAVSGLFVGYMDTDMIRELDVPKSDPAEIARAAVDGVESGAPEILADDAARQIKAQLAGDIGARYPQLAGA